VSFCLTLLPLSLETADSFIGEILAAPHRDFLDLCCVYKSGTKW